MNLNPPEQIQVDKLIRSILADKPRLTKFNINWDENETLTTCNNYNFMFDEGKKTNEIIQNNFKNNNISDKYKPNEEELKNLFANINNNNKLNN